MNGVFLFGIIILFLYIHTLLGQTYQNCNTYRFIFTLSIPEIIILLLCSFTEDISYFFLFLFSFQTFITIIYFVFSFLEKPHQYKKYSYFLFLLLYLFLVFASFFRIGKQRFMPFELSSVLSLVGFLLLLFCTIRKQNKEPFSWYRIFYIILIIILTFLLFFIGKIVLISPYFMGMFFALPHVSIFVKLKEEQNGFSYFIKEEVYHFFLLALFNLLVGIPLIIFQNKYLLSCCHFGMLSHVLLFLNLEKKSYFISMISILLFILGYLYFFL